MANTKITGLTENTTVAASDLLHVIDNPASAPLNQKATVANVLSVYDTTTATLTNKTLTSPKINEDVALTATATELNILDGATVSTAELNILDGVTATATELNVLDGIPATLTATELGYVDGVTSAIQTQLDGKAASSHTHTSSEITDLTSATHSNLNADSIDITEGTTSANGINFGSDTNLYRSGSNTLQTDDALAVNSLTSTNAVTSARSFDIVRLSGTIFTSKQTTLSDSRFEFDINGVLKWGSGSAATDTNLYRNGANELKTDDNLIVGAPGTSAGSVATVDGTQTLTNKTVSDTLIFTGTKPLRITEQSSTPSSPTTNDLYLDDGTNTASGNPGWRRYNGSGWEDVGASSGSSSSSLIKELDWSNAVLPDTNFPSLGKTSGTNWVYKTLDFDPSTDEACYWTVHLPTTFSPSSATLILHWTASSGTAAQAVYWQATVRSIGNDQVIDATTTPNTSTASGNDALLATGDIHRVDLSLTLTDWAAGEVLLIKLNRDADNGSDNLSGDAKLVKAVLEVA